jgi:putative transposase
MARAWRIEYKGALYHVLSRGNQRGDIVGDDRDRKLFLDTVGEMSQRFEVDICAFVLMDNHILCGAPHKIMLCEVPHYVKLNLSSF